MGHNFIIILRVRMDKFKIEITLKASPEKQKQKQQQKIPMKLYEEGVIYSRTPTMHKDNYINLRERIVNPKQCLMRPFSQKERESQMFTQKCLQILSKKRKGNPCQANQTKIHTMMTSVIDKYKKVINTNRAELVSLKNNYSKILEQPKAHSGYSQLNGFEDTIQVYRMIKSTEVCRSKADKDKKREIKEQLGWKCKPDVTGIRTNNNILKSQSHEIQGVQCFSLPISEMPLTKRQSLIFAQPLNLQHPRTASASSCRRKVSIGRVNSQKFMAFSLNSDSDGLYIKKLKSFLDFIFKINYSNKIYVNLQLSEDTINIKKYKVYVGKGNNSLLIKSLLKRRFWLEIVENIQQEDISFYWTQNRVKKVHHRQSLAKTTIGVYKPSSKRREVKDSEEKEGVELNKKILLSDECYNVEQFICKDGYYVPFECKYVCNLVTNHVPRNSCIGSKKNLFKSLLFYYRDYLKVNPFDYIPKTYNVKGCEDSQFKKFLKDYEGEPNKVWIVKPGQNSNRGNGIKLAETNRVVDLVRRRQKHENGQTKTYILQSYIDKPFLYNGRKFDIRHYMMITSVNGMLKAYWYKEGYIRTSSEKYDIEDLSNEQMHLTNDAIQKKYEQYEKYEPGNKLSYAEFQRYLDLSYSSKGHNFQKDIIPKMRSIILDVVKANYNIIDKSRRECNFEIFGFDFMIDKDFKPWLIEINFNPCLEVNCPVLSRIIPTMVENSLRVGLDPLLPPTNHYPGNKRFSLTDNFLRNLKFELLFDEKSFEETIPSTHDISDSDDEEEEYNDEGKEVEELII